MMSKNNSTRTADKLENVCFVDFDKAFDMIYTYLNPPLIPRDYLSIIKVDASARTPRAPTPSIHDELD